MDFLSPKTYTYEFDLRIKPNKNENFSQVIYKFFLTNNGEDFWVDSGNSSAHFLPIW